MSLSLTCPHCARKLGIKNPTSGKPVKCPCCAGVLPVPQVAVDAWWQDVVEAPRREYGAPLKAVAPRWYRRLDARWLGAGVTAALLFGVGVAAALWPEHVETPVVAVAVQPEPSDALALTAVVERTVEEPLPAPPMELTARLAPLADEVPLPEEPVAVQPALPAEPQRYIVKRRDSRTDEDLRKQLLAMTELTLEGPGNIKARSNNTVGGGPVGNQLLSLGGNHKLGQLAHFTPTFLGQRADLQGLPFRMGADCQLGKEPAEDMQAL
ncbi:MAG: hypothetical protein JNM56_36875, partial [Planctomycetia bacterium]|nr:hypothetical protein [Planctomycetia bacterium]